MKLSSFLQKIGPALGGTTAILSDWQWKNAYKQQVS